MENKEIIELESLKALKRIRETDIFVDFETNGCKTLNDIEDVKKDLDIIKEDLIVLEILAQCLIFRESYYLNQADYSAETITMGWLDKNWIPEKIYNKVREWCFKHKIKGTEI